MKCDISFWNMQKTWHLKWASMWSLCYCLIHSYVILWFRFYIHANHILINLTTVEKLSAVYNRLQRVCGPSGFRSRTVCVLLETLTMSVTQLLCELVKACVTACVCVPTVTLDVFLDPKLKMGHLTHAKQQQLAHKFSVKANVHRNIQNEFSSWV